jgi:single-stranded DNA-specific DHH superfamily exonuclease
MLSLQDLLKVRTFITHDSCSDGTASALILQAALPRVPIRFVQYGTDAHKNLPAEEGLLFCDMSPPEGRTAEFVAAGSIVLDHHATARPVVEAFGEKGVFGDEKTQPGICGATLAYSEVWKARYPAGDPAVERFATLAGVRDTWQRSSPDWVLACQQGLALSLASNDVWQAKGLATILSEWEGTWAPLGRILHERQQRDVEKAIKRAYWHTTDKGTKVAILTTKGLVSDAAEALGDRADFVVGITFAYEPATDPYPRLILSTRSRGTFDCGAFCQHYGKRFGGGGGHRKAAGCTVPLDGLDVDPFRYVARLMRFYEAGQTGPERSETAP